MSNTRRRHASFRRFVNPVISVADQGLSSATNMALAVVVAASGTTLEFGAVGLVTALYILEVTLVRGAVGGMYMVMPPDLRRATRRDAVGAATLIGLALGALAVPAGLVASGSLRGFLLAYAVLTPGLIVQDSARYMLYAERRAPLNLRSNIIWATVQIALTVVALGNGSLIGLLFAWGLGGWASAAYCLWQLRCPPWPTGLNAWFRGRVRYALSWVTDGFVVQGIGQALVWTIGAVAGLSAVGAYRGAGVLTGPATVIVGGLGLGVVLPAAVRRAHQGDGSLETFVTHRVVPGFGLVAAVVLMPLLVLPDRLGEFLLNDTWEASRDLLPLIVAGRILNDTTLGFVLGMRALADRRWSLYLRFLSGGSMLVGATGAAVRWGAAGAATALLIIAAFLLPLWWLAFLHVVRSSPASGAGGTAEQDMRAFSLIEGQQGPGAGRRRGPAAEGGGPTTPRQTSTIG